MYYISALHLTVCPQLWEKHLPGDENQMQLRSGALHRLAFVSLGTGGRGGV